MRRKKKIIKMVLIVLVSMIISSGSTYAYFGIIQKNRIIKAHSTELEKYKISAETFCYILDSDVQKNEKFDETKLKSVKIPKALKSKSLIKDSKKLKKSFFNADYKKGCVLYKNMVYNYNNIGNDLRRYQSHSVILPDDIQIGDYVDIRINFSSGLDYVVLAKKKIRSISQNKEEKNNNPLISLYLNSEEILRFSSAIVDSYINEGTYLYSTIYLDSDSQKAAKITYPSNPMVRKLIENDPNIIKKAKLGLEKNKEIIDKTRENIKNPENSENQAEAFQKEGTNQNNEILEDEDSKDKTQNQESEDKITMDISSSEDIN